MKKYELLKIGMKSISISTTIVLLGGGSSIMIAFFLCFIQEASFRFPLGIANIVTEQDGEGHYTTISFENALSSILIISLILSILLFIVFYLIDRRKAVIEKVL